MPDAAHLLPAPPDLTPQCMVEIVEALNDTDPEAAGDWVARNQIYFGTGGLAGLLADHTTPEIVAFGFLLGMLWGRILPADRTAVKEAN